MVGLPQKKQKVIDGIGGDLNSTIKKIFEQSLDLEEKLRDPKLVKERIIKKTNKLLDDGNFQRAQELIALAEKIPDRLAVAVKSGDVALKKENYKQAEKSYKQAADLANEISEPEMEAALLLKAEKAKTFPGLQKDQKSAILKLEKPFSSLDKRVRSVYRVGLDAIDDAIKISDKLEDDPTIQSLKELEELTEEAKELSRDLDAIDSKIRAALVNFLEKWNK